MKARSATVEVEVWLDEILDEFTDDELDAEMRRRGMPNSTKDAALDALIMLKTGRIDDGIAALEREFFPKWEDRTECQRQYAMAMGLEAGRAAA